jgi:hypothetical protein
LNRADGRSAGGYTKIRQRDRQKFVPVNRSNPSTTPKGTGKMFGSICRSLGVMLAVLTMSTFLLGGAAQATSGATAQPSRLAQQSSSSGVAPLATMLYRIAIKTGDMDGAGTDSTVYLRLCGTAGCTPSRSVEDPNKDDRERGQTDYHFRDWEYVGTLTHILLYQADDGGAWNLDWVEVKYNGQTVTFPYDGWMSLGLWKQINKG